MISSRFARHLLWLMLGLSATTALAQQRVMGDGFEDPFDFMTSDAEAARLLNQATFGATASSISTLRSQSLRGWIRQQSAVPATLARPFLEALAVTENQAGNSLSQAHRIQRWLDTAVRAPDQLRQKVAYALGQMIVVSDQDSNLNDQIVLMAEWNDLIVRNALGNFRTLLGEVARSPAMGRYLTFVRNRKFEVTPRCTDQRSPLNDNTNTANDLRDAGGNVIQIVLDATDYHNCETSDATNNGTMPPKIVAYALPSSGPVAPDENFAREVMQLFTIGLIERNADFTPILIGGETVPTYTQRTITELSRVLTGFNYACSGDRTVAGQVVARACNCTGVDCNFSSSAFFGRPPSLTLNGESGLVHPDTYEPMVCYPRYHDTGRDRRGFQLPGAEGVAPAGATIELAAGQVIPGGTPAADKVLELGGSPMLTLDEVSPGAVSGRLASGTALDCDNASTPQARSACVTYCEDSLDAALDLLFLEPNTASMVSRQLIQRLVSSNPSAAYIQRVAEVFADNGNGVRGDLLAVVQAVLTDAEARQAPDPAASSAGKTREPLLKLVQLWRSFEASSGDTRADGYRRWAALGFGVLCGNSSWPQCAYSQRPLGSPTVFNFYEPDFSAPGAISDAGLVSPELQIINESSSVLAANDLFAHLCAGWGGVSGSSLRHDCRGPLTAPSDRAYFPTTALDSLAGGNCGTACSGEQDAALVETINVRLFGGSMSGDLGDPGNAASAANTGMKGSLLRLIRVGLNGSLGEADPLNARRRKILYALHLAAISPEFATQR